MRLKTALLATLIATPLAHAADTTGQQLDAAIHG